MCAQAEEKDPAHPVAADPVLANQHEQAVAAAAVEVN